MTKRSKDSSEKLSSRQQKEVAAYIDGELSAGAERKVEGALKQRSEAFLLELNALKEIRRELRDWFYHETLDEDGKPCRVDLWDSLKRKIDAGEADRVPLGDRIREFFFIRGMDWSPHSFVAGAVAMFCMVFAGNLVYQGGETAPQQLALEGGAQPYSAAMPASLPLTKSRRLTPAAAGGWGNGGLRIETAGSGIARETPNSTRRRSPVYVGVRDFSSDLFVLVPPAGSGEPRREPRGIVLRMPVSELMGPRVMGDGMRTDGVDIDWIKSDKPFKIVPSRNRAVPPVIWVSR